MSQKKTCLEWQEWNIQIHQDKYRLHPTFGQHIVNASWEEYIRLLWIHIVWCLWYYSLHHPSILCFLPRNLNIFMFFHFFIWAYAVIKRSIHRYYCCHCHRSSQIESTTSNGCKTPTLMWGPSKESESFCTEQGLILLWTVRLLLSPLLLPLLLLLLWSPISPQPCSCRSRPWTMRVF